MRNFLLILAVVCLVGCAGQKASVYETLLGGTYVDKAIDAAKSAKQGWDGKLSDDEERNR